ncbi:MAG: hypothetical protein WA885_13860 [Phormidesmis sp.]
MLLAAVARTVTRFDHKTAKPENQKPIYFSKRLKAETPPKSPDGAFGDRRQLLEDHREAVVEQIQQLQENLAVINWKIQYYSELEDKPNEHSKIDP